jgi:hypothetical protein
MVARIVGGLMSEASILLSLIQPQNGDATGHQKVLRTLTMQAAPTVMVSEADHDLSTGDLLLDTEFTGPWQLNIIAVSFLRLQNGLLVPDSSIKDLGLYLVLDGDEFPLRELIAWNGRGAILTDPIALGISDQIRVRSSGTCVAKVKVRGVQL